MRIWLQKAYLGVAWLLVSRVVIQFLLVGLALFAGYSFGPHIKFGFFFLGVAPIVLLILGRIGLINSTMLRGSRKVVVIISLVVAMIISPSPDVISMMIMALPLYVLFEISIWLIFISERKKKIETPTD